MSTIKYKIFKGIHDYPVDVWIMWIILVSVIIAILLKIYTNATDYSESYQFIKNL